jgi:hypothetical protein
LCLKLFVAHMDEFIDDDNTRCNGSRHRHFFNQQFFIVLVVLQVNEEENGSSQHRGSIVGWQTIRRDKVQGFHCLMQDYFVDQPV